MKFQKHTSPEMVTLFSQKPYQGQVPEEAQIIFLSSDANYSPEISTHSFFEYILEYQKDGSAFWLKYGCHHPFMLQNYPKEFNKNKNGVPFHRNFRKLGLGPEYAGLITFIELLDVPTIGNKSENREKFFELISSTHLRYLETLMLGGGHKLFFVSNGVLKDIERIRKAYPFFAWLDIDSKSSRQLSQSINGNNIKEIYHFSSSQIHNQLPEIKSEINDWIKKN
jgi:hypothetical protein